MFKFLLLTILVLSSTVYADDDVNKDKHALLGSFKITVTGGDNKCIPTGTANFDTTDTANPTLTIATWSGCSWITGTDPVVFKPIVANDKPDLTFENLLTAIQHTFTTDTKNVVLAIAKEGSITYTNKDGTVDSKWTANFTLTSEDTDLIPDGTYNYEVTFEYSGPLLCLKGEYEDTDKKICAVCDTLCTECTSATVCTACKDGYGIDDTNKICHKCLGATFLLNHICTPCHDKCGTCANADTCLTCVEHYGLNTQTNLCEVCKDNEWSKDSKTCTPCPGTCATCETDKKCIDCTADNYLPQDGGVCRVCHPEGEWTDKVNKICKNCPLFCKTCDSDTTCQSCKDHSGLIDGKGVCQECGDRQVSKDDACHNCKDREIREGNICKGCKSNEIVEGNTCKACAPKQWADGNVCKDCGADCTECTNADTCTKCVETHEVKEGKCVKKSSGLGGGVIALIIIVILAIIAGAGFFFYKKKQGQHLTEEMDYKSVVA